MEMIIKVVAWGLFASENCYLRDSWNWLDATVVVVSIASYLPSVSNVSSLRTFRLFRPLKYLKKFQSMRELVTTLLESLMQLTNILILLVFCLLIFAILGLQIWPGLTHYRCRLTEAPVNGDWAVVDGDFRICGGVHQCNTTAGHACGSLFDPSIQDQLYKIEDGEQIPWTDE